MRFVLIFLYKYHNRSDLSSLLARALDSKHPPAISMPPPALSTLSGARVEMGIGYAQEFGAPCAPLLDRGPVLPLQNDTIRLWALHSLRISCSAWLLFYFILGVWGDGVLGGEGKGGKG